MRKLEDVLKEELKNPEFKKEWDALEPEFRMIREKLNTEARQKLVQRQSESHEQIVLAY